MSNDVEIDFNFPDFKQAGEKIRNALPGLIAAVLQTQRAMIFDDSGEYNGRSGWEPLKSRNGQPLKDRGTLSRSIGPANDGITPGYATGSIVRLSDSIVTIGTNIAYAAVHDQGAVIYPKKPGGVLRFKIGNRWICTKKVTIPKRNFSDIMPLDIRELRDTIENFIVATIENG